VKIASAAFVQAVAASPPAAREVLVAHAIHLLELQQLSCLAADAGAIAAARPHDPTVARMSADLVASIANALATTVRGSVAAAVRRSARQGGAAPAMLDAAASCAAPVLTLTLTWLVATCLRVARDCGVAASRLTKGTRPIPPLHAQVFRAVRASGLLRTLRALGGAMADAQPRSRSRPGHERKPQVWKDALRVTDALAAHMWADADGPCGLADELLAGWQLPDGTVWGRTPLEPDTLHPPSAPGAKDDTPSAQWRQLRWLVSVALEALPQLLVAIDAGDAAAPPPALQAAPGYDGDQDSCPTDAEQEPETICYRGRLRPAVAVAEPPAARVSEKPAQGRTMPTPLVDTERDEVVCAATAAAMRTHPARGAIGAHRSGPTTMARSSSGSASPAGGRAWQPLDQQLSAEHYSAQTAVNPAAVPEEYGMTAIHAWQHSAFGKQLG
ncbi:hypothetical protein H4R21_002946, partial [Coemansia helicoidea]